MRKGKRVLVAPLDWGLGHATRCVPVILELMRLGLEPVLGAHGKSMQWLRQRFPGMEMLDIPGFTVRYPRQWPMALAMARQLPSFLASIRRERMIASSLIDRHGLGAIISDNRYGVWSSRVPSVFLGHQVRIQGGAFSGWLHRIQVEQTRHFDACWVPDFPEQPGLAGTLSHGGRWPNMHYVGPLSRFSALEGTTGNKEESYRCVALLSGPEPQRSILETLLFRQLQGKGIRTLFLRGLADGPPPGEDQHITWKDHVDDATLVHIMRHTSAIISRSGYSTLMDLRVVGKKAIFIPTPGQTEQIYLANLAQDQGWAVCADQKNLHLAASMELLDKLQDPEPCGGGALASVMASFFDANFS